MPAREDTRRVSMRGMSHASLRLLLIVLALLISCVGGRLSYAEVGPWVGAGAVQARLVSAMDATGQEAAHKIALDLRLKDGWKTYWRTPGDAGLPPQLDWSGSRNLASAQMAWPAPRRFTISGLENFGWEKEVALPIEVVLQRPGEDLSLRLALDLLVCSDICVPEHVDLALELPTGPAMADPVGSLVVARAIDAVPGDGRLVGLYLDSIRVDGPRRLVIVAHADQRFENPDIIVEAPPGAASGPQPSFERPAVVFDDARRMLTAIIQVALPEGSSGSLASRQVTVTLVDGVRSAERQLSVGEETVVDGLRGWGAVLLTAFLGGLILNLMPCVLPVLSLKLLAVTGCAGIPPRQVRAGFLATAAGIVTSFLVLAGTTIALKAAGLAFGWGIQFQSPYFLIFMLVVISFFWANLAGFFEIALPGRLADFAMNTGQVRGGVVIGGRTRWKQEFFIGAFATLLATPCSAPFLGTAISFALAHGIGEILLIFTLLGTGLAFPYLCVAAFPSLVTRMPRPGAWMLRLRRILAMMLGLTGGWLVWLLAQRQGWPVALTALGSVAIVVVLAVLSFRYERAPPVRRLALALIGLVALTIAFTAPGFVPDTRAAISVEARRFGRWATFQPERIAAAVAAGQTVFVEVTAEWCLTCKLNEHVVLENASIARLLANPEIVAMRADWTRPDPAITRFLQENGRYGIPFAAVFGPKATSGIVLPELLTAKALIDAIASAR